MQKLFHRHEDSCIISRGSEEQVTPLESCSNNFGSRGNGDIKHHGFDAEVAQAGGDDFRCIFCISVYRSVGNHNPVFFRRISAPFHILIENIFKIASPHKAVKRTNHLNIKAVCFFEQGLHLRPVFSDDVAVITASLVHIFIFKIHFIRENCSVQRSESSEGICGEKRTCRFVESNHNLRPVYHRRKDEFQNMVSGVERIPLFYHECAVSQIHMEKLRNHRENFFVRYDFHIRVTEQKFRQRCRMIRFHVLNNYKVKFSATKLMLNVFKKSPADGFIHGIKKNGQLIF